VRAIRNFFVIKIPCEMTDPRSHLSLTNPLELNTSWTLTYIYTSYTAM